MSNPQTSLTLRLFNHMWVSRGGSTHDEQGLNVLQSCSQGLLLLHFWEPPMWSCDMHHRQSRRNLHCHRRDQGNTGALGTRARRSFHMARKNGAVTVELLDDVLTTPGGSPHLTKAQNYMAGQSAHSDLHHQASIFALAPVWLSGICSRSSAKVLALRSMTSKPCHSSSLTCTYAKRRQHFLPLWIDREVSLEGRDATMFIRFLRLDLPLDLPLDCCTSPLGFDWLLVLIGNQGTKLASIFPSHFQAF